MKKLINLIKNYKEYRLRKFCVLHSSGSIGDIQRLLFFMKSGMNPAEKAIEFMYFVSTQKLPNANDPDYIKFVEEAKQAQKN